MPALKIWNGRNPDFPNADESRAWCVPRKGTKEHAEVKEIMRTGELSSGKKVVIPDEPKPAPIPKPKPQPKPAPIPKPKPQPKPAPAPAPAPEPEPKPIRRKINFVVKPKPAPPAPEPAPEPIEDDDTNIEKWLKLYDEVATAKQKNDYKPSDIMANIFWYYLLDKYKNNCYVISNFKEPTTEKDPKYKTSGKKRALFETNIGITLYNFPKYTLAMPTSEVIKETGELIKECLDRGVKLIVMPLNLPGHANMLIYRAKDNSFERFEPHGRATVGRTNNDKVNDIVKKIIKIIEKNGDVPNGVKYYDAADVCPLVSGFQSMENTQYRQAFGGKPQGFCSLWSLFFAEMALKYPNLASDEIVAKAIVELKKKGPTGFFNHIANYTKYVEEGIGKIMDKPSTYRALKTGKKEAREKIYNEIVDWWYNYIRDVIRKNKANVELSGGCIQYLSHR
jgi:hypothetical protein